MSTLLVDELMNGITFEQNIRLHRSISAAFIRPWIYKHGTLASGKLRLRVFDGATLLKLVEIDYTDINAAFTQSYAHGYIRFDVAPLFLGVNDNEAYHDYTLKISMFGYVDDVNNFLGVCREWDQRKYPIFGTEPANDATEPCGYEIFEYRS
jgi:hypothetical protein